MLLPCRFFWWGKNEKIGDFLFCFSFSCLFCFSRMPHSLPRWLFFFFFFLIFSFFSSTSPLTSNIALETFYLATDGPNWDIRNGWVHFFSLPFPCLFPSFSPFISLLPFVLSSHFFSSKMSGNVCDLPWHGVTCDLSDNVTVVALVFIYHFPQPMIFSSQKITFSLHFCSFISFFQSSNGLNGTIPSELGVCTSLAFLFFFFFPNYSLYLCPNRCLLPEHSRAILCQEVFHREFGTLFL